MITINDVWVSAVLILVLVEHTLGEVKKNSFFSKREVLILVLVEHTLGVVQDRKARYLICLNPCFSGTYSRSTVRLTDIDEKIRVLILVLVEHTLGAN